VALVVASAALLREHALRRYVALPFRGNLDPAEPETFDFRQDLGESADPSSRTQPASTL
jgi:hypothetical protein